MRTCCSLFFHAKMDVQRVNSHYKFRMLDFPSFVLCIASWMKVDKVFPLLLFAVDQFLVSKFYRNTSVNTFYNPVLNVLHEMLRGIE